MKDIVRIAEGFDLGIADAVAPKAANILRVQIGDLDYIPTFGVDFRFFLQDGLQFQNSSFKAYIVQRLSSYRIDVFSVIEVIENLFEQLTFEVGDGREKEGFVAI